MTTLYSNIQARDRTRIPGRFFFSFMAIYHPPPRHARCKLHGSTTRRKSRKRRQKPTQACTCQANTLTSAQHANTPISGHPPAQPARPSTIQQKMKQQTQTRTHAQKKKVPNWFAALETHGPFPGPAPAPNADGYMAEDSGSGGSVYGGGASPRSVYGGTNLPASSGGGGISGCGGSGRSVGGGSSRSVIHGRGAGGGGGGGGFTGLGTPALHRRADSGLSVKSGLGLNRTGGAGGAAGG